MAVDKLVDSAQLDTDLTAVAYAIRTKGGTSASLAFPNGFVDAIDAIETGGGGGIESVPDNDVAFIDYDGTIVYSYSASEFAEITEMPPNPSHSGLTAQGWNWTLADAKEFVAEYGGIDIGQSYITDDWKTRFYVEVIGHDIGPANIKFKQSVNNGVSVDWGDGTAPETYTGTGITTRSHTYASDGLFTITFTVNSGTLTLAGTWNSSCMGEQVFNCANLLKVECGTGVTGIGEGAFSLCCSLKSITIPEGVTSMTGNNAFSSTAIRCLVIPKTCTTYGAGNFANGAPINRFCFPKSISNSNSYIGNCAFVVRCVLYPKMVFWGAVFQNAKILREVIMPEGVSATLGGNAFQNCFNLTTLTIPTTITQIQAAFTNCYGLKELHMKATTPPTLTGTHFGSVASDFQIYVPYSDDHSVLTAYQEATNWSTYASKIQEEQQ